MALSLCAGHWRHPLSDQYSAEEKAAEEQRVIKIFTDRLPKRRASLLVSQWAERTRILPQGLTSRPGPFRFTESEPMREIVDCLSESSPVREVVLMKGAQLGGTVAVIENFIGYIISQAPGPTLAVTGDKEMADSWMDKRVDPMIESCGLRHLIFSQVQKRHGRTTGDTKDSKSFPGGFLKSIGPNSGSKLRSDAIQYLLLDEEDAYPQEVQGEGDPIALAIRRTDTFENSRKIMHISTPLIKGTSRIEAAYIAGDQRKYFVPCKHCGAMQELEFGQLKWQLDHRQRLVWESVRYVCKHCQGEWRNEDKAIFLSRGEWRATAEPAKRHYRSYHLSSLYSSVGARSWESIVEEWVNIRDDHGRRRTFINTVLGETWEERGEAPKWERIMLRNRLGYESGTLPAWHQALMLTMGVDIQKDRIEAEIVAWGEGSRSWSVSYHVLMGETVNPDSDSWRALRSIMEQKHAGMVISLALIDAGYNTSQVYGFCESYAGGVMPVMSEPTNNQGRNIFAIRQVAGYATQRVNIQSGQLKSELYGYLGREPSETPPMGFCGFPQDYPEEYFKQLTAESLVQTKLRSGAVKFEWKKSRERNEALDCRIYAMAALYVFAAMVRGEVGDDEPISWDDFWLLMAGSGLDV
jgi:phage terminase large subunit GpA-like protein